MIYLVGTPIGNMADITLRALETLRAVDVVACEDTRKTGLLLKRYDIKKPLISFYEHNEEQAVRRVLGVVAAGQSVALVTTAGMPGISDPGYTLVRAALEVGIPVQAIPGPTAFVLALVLSGLPVHAFTFRGFPPRKPSARRRFLAVDRDSPHTLIFYESPYRLRALLADALAVYGDREASVANDLTKLFERVDCGRLSELIVRFGVAPIKGEYTVLIAGAAGRERATPDDLDAGDETTVEMSDDDECRDAGESADV
jgi:16S rRNA (cytidine1402-2'-O)-methyltransferase